MSNRVVMCIVLALNNWLYIM